MLVWQRTIFTTAGAVCLSALSSLAQEPAPQQQQGPPAQQSPANPSRTNPTQPNVPGQNRPDRFPSDRDRQQLPEMQRPIFLSGKVVLDDGTPPPEPVTIERVCGGSIRPEGYTDSKGRFSFELGRNSALMPDASIGNDPTDPFGSQFPGSARRGNTGMGGVGNSNVERMLNGCELRASLPGFRSEAVTLAGRRVLDNPEVGTIILRRLANVEGFTFSATSGLAPKDARKAFEKSRNLLKKNKIDEAQQELEKATGLYAKYAVAWYDLGRIYESKNQPDDARKAFESSIVADSRYVNPYLNLSGMYIRDKNWEKTVEMSARAIKLNPFEFPQMHFYNAVANLNMSKMDDAEKAAREAKKLDAKGRIPKVDHLLGIILAEKKDFAGAAESLRAYLKADPAATDADQIRKQLEQLDKAVAAGQ